jgi:hypothetical protein
MTSKQPFVRAGACASSARSRSSHSYCACSALPSTLLSSAISRQSSVSTRVKAMKPPSWSAPASKYPRKSLALPRT